MTHEITVKSGGDIQKFYTTGGVLLIGYDSPADGEETGRAMSIIWATPQDAARAMLGEDGLNGQMMRQFAKGLCDALYAGLKRSRHD